MTSGSKSNHTELRSSRSSFIFFISSRSRRSRRYCDMVEHSVIF